MITADFHIPTYHKKSSQPWNSLSPSSLPLFSPLTSWPNLRLSPSRERLSSSSELTAWMCGVMITEHMNQTPASAQDPFVCRLVIRMSTIALKLASVEVSKVLDLRSRIFRLKRLGSDQMHDKSRSYILSKDFQRCGGSLRYLIMYRVFATLIQTFRLRVSEWPTRSRSTIKF